ncbi:hypothetical protein BOX37_13820 [Nocardia mangyaensis]|uniref:Uncharacterized protein n=1 Tax=Nocardia mangyaensis TaxID=2213200 RepID=A0A1J0VS38_9NOCA|nr:hypothetical protein [Nocardia mangyaensis]APE34846.1 hypothetical protein BOX37_13820 [Nocardia mangyaensis]
MAGIGPATSGHNVIAPTADRPPVGVGPERVQRGRQGGKEPVGADPVGQSRSVHQPTAAKAMQLPQAPGYPRSPPSMHVLPAWIRHCRMSLDRVCVMLAIAVAALGAPAFEPRAGAAR